MRRIAVYLLFAGATCFIFTVYFGLSAMTIYGGGINTRGIVIRNEDDGGQVFPQTSQTSRSVVQFEDAAGYSHEVRTAVASFPPEYQIGDPVEVAYLKDKPEDAKIVSGTDLFGSTIVASLVSNVLFFSGVFILSGIALIDRVRAARPTVRR